MSTSITMPQLGESVAEGTIGKWLKEPGDRIERDEPLVEVITDKVNAEIPSPVAGIVQRIVVPEGQTVPVGAELAVIGDAASAGEQPQETEAKAEQSGTPPSPAAQPPAPVAVASTEAPDADQTDEDGDEAGPKRASPLVRRLAREHGVDLDRLTGSGLGGRVTKNDILSFIEQRGEQPAAAQAPAPAAAPEAAPQAPAAPPSAPPRPAAQSPAPSPAPAAAGELSADEELVPLTAMRRTIAEHMVRSVQTSPHAWGMVEIDATSLARLRDSLVRDWQSREGFELTYLPFFIKAVVEALREFPVLNARWSDQGVVLKRRVNIGIAVAIQDGLVVPVIRDADQKSIAGLAHAVRDLAQRARGGRLGLDDIQGGTFTVNNTGALGSIASGPIINQPQAGIITMEAIVKRPVVLADDAIAIRSVMNSCLAFDHRITDGAEALRFLQSVKRRVEAYGANTAIY
jgi:2-oxoisovalerate dehydrogenase E2 component (dihydrolipoyl transacylase)